MPLNKPEPEYEGKPLSRWVAETKDEDERVRIAAARALGKIGLAAVPALTQLLTDKDEGVQMVAATLLGKIGPDAMTAVPALTQLLKDNNKWVRMNAALALGEIGHEAKTATPALMELLQENNGTVRQAAAWALGKIGPEAKSAVPALMQLLTDKDERVRVAASQALDEIDKDKKERLREVPLEDIKQGPIRQQEGLTPLLEQLAKAIFAEVGYLLCPTFEEWELGFLRDVHPWREILIWENIARTFDLVVAKRPQAAYSKLIAGTIVSISTGHVPENNVQYELRKLYLEACENEWSAPSGEPFTFPKNQALVLQYEDIVDEWDGAIHPNIRGNVDPRRVLTDADVIMGKASSSGKQFCIYGRDHLEDGGIPEGLKTLFIRLDTENEKTRELEEICYVVQQIKGRHDYQ